MAQEKGGYSRLAVGAIIAWMLSILMSVTYGQGSETRKKADGNCAEISALKERQSALDRYVQDIRQDFKEIKADIRLIAQAVPHG